MRHISLKRNLKPRCEILAQVGKKCPFPTCPSHCYRRICIYQGKGFRQRITSNKPNESVLKLHSHQTADQPPLIPDQFLWLGRIWSCKKLPALIEERIYPRSTPAVTALYPLCTHAQIPLFPTYPRSSGWPIPALHDKPPTYSWYNYAHYAQYRINPRFDFHSRPQINKSSKC